MGPEPQLCAQDYSVCRDPGRTCLGRSQGSHNIQKGQVGPEPGTPALNRLLLRYLAGNFKGLCKQIDHFPEDADYEADTAEYFLSESPTVF